MARRDEQRGGGRNRNEEERDSDIVEKLGQTDRLLVLKKPYEVIEVQRCLDALAGETPADPLIRALLDRAVGRLELLCANMLHRSYPRLTRPPLRQVM